MKGAELHAIVTMVIDGITCKAECSGCCDPLALQAAGASVEEQAAMLEKVFNDHVERKHRYERRAVAEKGKYQQAQEGKYFYTLCWPL